MAILTKESGKTTSAKGSEFTSLKMGHAMRDMYFDNLKIVEE